MFWGKRAGQQLELHWLCFFCKSWCSIEYILPLKLRPFWTLDPTSCPRKYIVVRYVICVCVLTYFLNGIWTRRRNSVLSCPMRIGVLKGYANFRYLAHDKRSWIGLTWLKDWSLRCAAGWLADSKGYWMDRTKRGCGRGRGFRPELLVMLKLNSWQPNSCIFLGFLLVSRE